ncbi:hypothetical protein FB451DRAFT_1180512 [Mycena latifolia]|nr:hypothetical protein FB451DRAFT_1180512 [Mycena latifolia]
MTLNDSGAYICARREVQPQGAFRGQIAAGAGGAAREHAYSTRPRETHAEPRKAQTRAEAVQDQRAPRAPQLAAACLERPKERALPMKPQIEPPPVVGHCLAHAADSLVRLGPGRQGILDEFVHTQNTLASLSLIPITWDIYRTGSRRSKARGNICAGSCRSYSAPGTLVKRAHQAVGLPLTGAALPSRHVPISLVLNCDAAVHSAAAIPHPSATSLPTLCYYFRTPMDCAPTLWLLLQTISLFLFLRFADCLHSHPTRQAIFNLFSLCFALGPPTEFAGVSTPSRFSSLRAYFGFPHSDSPVSYFSPWYPLCIDGMQYAESAAVDDCLLIGTALGTCRGDANVHTPVHNPSPGFG